ncbi:hypothetical protein NUU61_005374 [Penicillium alfredii]|uniref:Autophagy-related protein Atg28 n=1 Tax=Penicillium alfredii TaxID=1506179 RepID=A0A9W9F9A9_9EURO|nr:uncharacterized protein NUU61_005374 [Penicillium alfredii]KAJ5096018.1 hypothetical protein NUU61_005374 [Penicillium alfredii]
MSTILPFRDKRLPPVPAAATSMYYPDPLLHVERQAKHIQNNLQALIDAQSDGLLSGLARPQSDDASSGSFTPTSTKAGRSQSPSTIPARRSAPKKIGLLCAREGIFQSIYDLLKLREEEREILSSQTDERDKALHEIQGFNSRRSGLEEAIATIHSDQENQHSKHLQEEARSLETDIHELENRLYEMKARHRGLVNKISHINNSVDAKLSSYTESLSLLQSDIQNYLRDPPVQPLPRTAGKSTFHSLNPQRRTLEMAQEHWNTEQADLQRRQQKVDAEILALEEGGGVWKQVVTDVSGFEKWLKANMRHYVQMDTSATGSNGAQVPNTKQELIKNILEDLEKTTRRVEAHLDLAEAKDWKLLVCCIAAELEALREARGMLLPAFGLPAQEDAPSPSSPARGEPREDHSDSHTDPLGNDNPDPPAGLLKDGDAPMDATSRSDEEDDEPDPAWLLPES